MKSSGIARYFRQTHNYQNDDIKKLKDKILQMRQGMRHLHTKSLHQTYQANATLDVSTEKLAQLPFSPLSLAYAAHLFYEYIVPKKPFSVHSKECVRKGVAPEGVSAEAIFGGKAIKNFLIFEPFCLSDAFMVYRSAVYAK